LAVTSEKREPSFPNVPTVGDTVPGYEATAWFGVGMPRGTPPDIVNKMNAAINKAISQPKTKERLAELGGALIVGTPADFGKVIQAETNKWEKVVKFSGATAE
jgi:tripartite-type tricarboxylate transporter receptor subunit TctC